MTTEHVTISAANMTARLSELRARMERMDGPDGFPLFTARDFILIETAAGLIEQLEAAGARERELITQCNIAGDERDRRGWEWKRAEQRVAELETALVAEQQALDEWKARAEQAEVSADRLRWRLARVMCSCSWRHDTVMPGDPAEHDVRCMYRAQMALDVQQAALAAAGKDGAT